MIFQTCTEADLTIDLAFSLTLSLGGKYNKYAVAEAFRTRVLEQDLLKHVTLDIEALLGEKMLVVIANDLPPAVRGRMKLWFIEPRPNVFVSGIKDSVAREVIDYILGHCPPQSGLLIFQRIPEAPGYKLYGLGDPHRQIVTISGLQLVLEKDTPQSGSDCQ